MITVFYYKVVIIPSLFLALRLLYVHIYIHTFFFKKKEKNCVAYVQANMEPPYPLHPSVAARVHPEYAAFYNKYIIDKQQVHLQPVSASRVGGVIIPGGGAILPVGKTEDFSVDRVASKGDDPVKVRVFTPEGTAPEAGWSVFLYFHGGGWVLGNIDTENTVCSNVCKRAGVVVVSVDYRYIYMPFFFWI
jgi:hypothetical protein